MSISMRMSMSLSLRCRDQWYVVASIAIVLTVRVIINPYINLYGQFQNKSR